MGYWPADSRRRAAGAHRQARYAYDGGLIDHSFGRLLDFVMGPTFRALYLDNNYRDAGIRRGRFRRRLSQAGEAAQSRPDRQAEAFLSVADRSCGLVRALYLDPVFRNQVFMERQHTVFQEHRGAQRNQRDRPLSLSGADRG